MKEKIEGGKKKPNLEIEKKIPPPEEPEKIDPKAMVDALGGNDMYANRNLEEPLPHTEDSEKPE